MSRLITTLLVAGPCLVLAALTAFDGWLGVQVLLLLSGGAMAAIGLLLDEQHDRQ